MSLDVDNDQVQRAVRQWFGNLYMDFIQLLFFIYSVTSSLDSRIKSFEFYSCIIGSKLPIYYTVFLVYISLFPSLKALSK